MRLTEDSRLRSPSQLPSTPYCLSVDRKNKNNPKKIDFHYLIQTNSWKRVGDGWVRVEVCTCGRTVITASCVRGRRASGGAEEQLPPRPRNAEPTTTAPKLSVEPTGVLHCLSCVTALKGEHATHCGEPDCSGVIDQLPGVIPRYRAAETNAGGNTRNLLSQAGSRRRGESSSLPQAKNREHWQGNVAVLYFSDWSKQALQTQALSEDAAL